jgi:hypothetical protein
VNPDEERLVKNIHDTLANAATILSDLSKYAGCDEVIRKVSHTLTLSVPDTSV